MSSVKVLVLGDSGVGSSTLVQNLCSLPLTKTSTTIGCSPRVMIHKKQLHVDLWDVGGSVRFQDSRCLFYNDAQGAILVHDLSNRRSYLNLQRWLKELKACLGAHDGALRWTEQAFHDDVLQLDVGGIPFPLLIVGSKLDLVQGTARLDEEGGAGADGVCVSAFDPLAFAPDSPGGLLLDQFLQRVAEQSAVSGQMRTPSSPLSVHHPVQDTSSLFDGLTRGIKGD